MEKKRRAPHSSDLSFVLDISNLISRRYTSPPKNGNKTLLILSFVAFLSLIPAGLLIIASAKISA